MICGSYCDISFPPHIHSPGQLTLLHAKVAIWFSALNIDWPMTALD
jgi:hypothetical protein